MWNNDTESKLIFSEYKALLVNGGSISSGWIDTQNMDKIQFGGYASDSGMTVTIESKVTDSSETQISTPVTYNEGNFYLFNVICRQRYMRFIWTNNTGSGVTSVSMELKTSYGGSDKLSVFPVNVTPSDFSQAALVQSILRGRDYDGNYVNIMSSTSGGLITADFNIEVLRGRISGVDDYGKFGQNNDIDSGDEDVWLNGGIYTGFNATSGEAVGVRSLSTNDVGTLVSSGTVTSGSSTTLVDSSATFISDGVGVGDCIINDTQQTHGIVKEVTSETTLTVWRFADDGDTESDLIPNNGDSYRVATAGGSGAFVVKIMKLIESDWAEWKSEYVILNGQTEVDSVGTDYIRCSTAEVVAGNSDGTIIGRQTTTTSNVFFSIVQGSSRTQVAADSIPSNKWLYINNAICNMGRANGSAGSSTAYLLIRKIGQPFAAKINAAITNSLGYESNRVISVPPFSDIKWNIPDVSDSNTFITAEFNGITVNI